MKIVFIGDSHLVGLKRSFSRNVVNNHLFFGHPSCADVNMGMVAVNNQSLMPTNDKLQAHFNTVFRVKEIDLRNTDIVVLTGLRLEFPYKLLEKTRYSNQVLKQAMMDMIAEQSLSLALAEKIRMIDKTMHIIVIPNPLITKHLQSVKIRTVPGIEPATTFGKLESFPNSTLHKWQFLLEKNFNILE